MNKQTEIIEAPKVIGTKDYDMFSLVKGNRVINKLHVAALRQSITKRNLLRYVPIIVNKDNQIADGQHRWLAAKELNVPIYYLKAADIEFADIVLLNSKVKPWKPEDYLLHFIDNGFVDYQKLGEFINKWHFSVSNGIAIMSIGSDRYLKSPLTQFRTGEWQITDEQKAEWFAKSYHDIAMYTEEKTSKDRDLMRAVYQMYFVLDLGIEHEDFMSQLKKYPNPIYRRLGMKEYLRQLEDIYNVGRKKPVRFL